jgi:hypothetical protein
VSSPLLIYRSLGSLVEPACCIYRFMHLTRLCIKSLQQFLDGSTRSCRNWIQAHEASGEGSNGASYEAYMCLCRWTQYAPGIVGRLIMHDLFIGSKTGTCLLASLGVES